MASAVSGERCFVRGMVVRELGDGTGEGRGQGRSDRGSGVCRLTQCNCHEKITGSSLHIICVHFMSRLH